MILQLLQCDRCGEKTGDADSAACSRIYAATNGLTDLIGTAEVPADLCAACSDELRAWFMAKRQAKSSPSLPKAKRQAKLKPETRPRGELALAQAECGALLEPPPVRPGEPLCDDGDPDWLVAQPEPAA